jgi:hypothetical protein
MSRFKEKPEKYPPQDDMSSVKAALKSSGYASEEVSES